MDSGRRTFFHEVMEANPSASTQQKRALLREGYIRWPSTDAKKPTAVRLSLPSSFILGISDLIYSSYTVTVTQVMKETVKASRHPESRSAFIGIIDENSDCFQKANALILVPDASRTAITEKSRNESCERGLGNRLWDSLKSHQLSTHKVTKILCEEWSEREKWTLHGVGGFMECWLEEVTKKTRAWQMWNVRHAG